MDLGKMLAESFEGHRLNEWADEPSDLHFNMQAVAEAFLAKVREAEDREAETRRQHEMNGADRW